MIVKLVALVIFWLNALPPSPYFGGNLSPRHIITGLTIVHEALLPPVRQVRSGPQISRQHRAGANHRGHFPTAHWKCPRGVLLHEPYNWPNTEPSEFHSPTPPTGHHQRSSSSRAPQSKRSIHSRQGSAPVTRT